MAKYFVFVYALSISSDTFIRDAERGMFSWSGWTEHLYPNLSTL